MRRHASVGLRAAVSVALMACTAGLYSLGSRENPAVNPVRDLTLRTGPGEARSAEYSLSAAVGLGAVILTVGWKSPTVRWAVARDDDGILGGGAAEGVAEAMDAGVSESVLTPGAGVPPIGAAYVAFGRIPGFGGDPLHEVGGATCRIPIGAFGEDRHVRLLLIHADGGWERIRFTASFEFFPGESALFAARGDLSYQQKAMAFLDSFFPEGSTEQAMFRRAAVRRLSGRYPRINPDGAFWDAFRAASDLDDERNAFRSVFLRHMTPVKGGLSDGSGNTALSRPTWDSLRWNLLYGNTGSPYVAAYLAFLAEIGKPLFSKVLDAELRSLYAGRTYDWRQYRPLSAGEGEELAGAALRYLHWGVEYSLPSGPGGSSAVYGENLDPLILAWVSGGDGDGERASNYLPSWAARSSAMPASGETGDLERAIAAADPSALSSPFAGGKGNPIPYANAGIDSPRTFAYKMREQARAREWYRRNATVADRAAEEDRSTAEEEGFRYVEERRLLSRLGRATGLERDGWAYLEYQPNPWPKAGDAEDLGPYASATDVLKPFLPGTGAMGASRFPADEAPGPYNSDKTAGVDSMGLLTGSVAMTALYSVVIGVENDMPAWNLDRYYAMKPGVAGLDASGLPAFYSDPWPEAGCSRGGYRLTRDDLEKSTILLPDLASLRRGDILVRDDDEDCVQVGIVVGFLSADFPAPGQDATDFMGQVIVLSTDRRQGCAYLSPWAGGAFTGEPKEFQARRLLLLSGSVAAAYGSDPWELMDASCSGLQVDLAFQGEKEGDSGSRWIPNTGGLLTIDKIGLKRINAWGGAEEIDPASKPVIAVLGPKDYAYRVEDATGTSNLYANKGGGVDFCAVPIPADRSKGKSEVRIATFRRVDGSAEYRVEPNPEFFGVDWLWKPDVELTVSSGCLVFRGGGLSLTTVFGLRVADMATARPGDDFLLRFGLVEKTGTDGTYEATIIGTVNDGDFTAVYDFPLLWRANLYIDEGPNDWNNRHPWKDPVKNEWYVSEADGAYMDGGQIDIKDWTHFNGTNILIDNSVAYSLGGTDSVADFNADLMEQEVAIQAYYSNLNPMWQTQENPHPPWASWTRTSAPSNDWLNYLIPYVATAGTLNPLTVGGNTLYPYRPGYATKRAFFEDPSRYQWYDVNYSAGVDCNGFVDRASSYAGNPYEIQAGNRVPEKREAWATPGLEHAKHPNASEEDSENFEGKSWLIWTDEPTANGLYPDSMKSDELPVTYLVPGDIVLFYTSTGRCDHIAIVNEIRSATNSRTVTRDGISLIEATSGLFGEYRVLKTQSLWEYRKGNTFKKWRFEIRRLVTR